MTEIKNEVEIQCPDSMKNHVEKVLAGEYEIPVDLKEPIFIYDIGANIGSFTLWAKEKWPNAVIYCFEPLKENFKLLWQNTKHLKNVNLFHTALEAPTNKIYLGKNNIGENSFFQLGEQQDVYETVDVLREGAWLKQGWALPDVFKADCEGCELIIIQMLLPTHKPRIIMFEYHREEDRAQIDVLLSPDYMLWESKATRLHRGVCKYVKKSLLEQNEI